MYGALGGCLSDGFYWEIHDSTNASDFLDFVTNLFGELLPLENGFKPLLIIDNHKAHLGDRIERME